MGFIAAGIGALIGGAASAVGGIVAGIASTIGAVAGSIVTAVGSVVSTIAASLGAALTPILKSVVGIVDAISGTAQAAIEVIRTTIAEPIGKVVQSLKAGIGDIAKALTEPLKPILDPIYDTLVTVHDFMADTQAWITTELKPVADLVGLIDDISALVVVKRILEGTTDIADILGDIEKAAGAKTAEAIAILWRDTVQITTGTLDIVRGHYTRLSDTIDGLDERLRKDMELAIKYAEEKLRGEVREIIDPLSERIWTAEREIAGIDRRTTDLPFFQTMLIRALE